MAYAKSVTAVRTDAVLCSACHGLRGEGAPAGAPRLAGQNPDYMAHALSMFKAGTRNSAVMLPIATGLSDQQMHELAAYFSKLQAPIPRVASAPSPALVLAGKQLAEDGTTHLASCFSCHGANGEGSGARFPAIDGQPAQFVIDRLHEFQARAQNGVPKPGSMTAIAVMMSEDQVQASAAYLSQSGGQ
jgi:cytochrome c553